MSYVIKAVEDTRGKFLREGDYLAGYDHAGQPNALYGVEHVANAGGDVSAVVRRVHDGERVVCHYKADYPVQVVTEYVWVDDSTPYKVKKEV